MQFGILPEKMLLPNTQIVTAAWAAAQDPAAWLMPSETAVWEAWSSPKRRADWLAGRLAAKRLLLETFGTDPRHCRIVREGAAPVVQGRCPPGLLLSLSHSSGRGAAAFCGAAAGAVGVDLQRVRPVHPRLAARVFSDREREQVWAQFGAAHETAGLLLLWALKEAAIKARRVPWGRALRDLDVRLTGPGQAEVLVSGEAGQAAQYAALEGGWWLARSIRPRELRRPAAAPDATA